MSVEVSFQKWLTKVDRVITYTESPVETSAGKSSQFFCSIYINYNPFFTIFCVFWGITVIGCVNLTGTFLLLDIYIWTCYTVKSCVYISTHVVYQHDMFTYIFIYLYNNFILVRNSVRLNKWQAFQYIYIYIN